MRKDFFLTPESMRVGIIGYILEQSGPVTWSAALSHGSLVYNMRLETGAAGQSNQ